MSLLLASTKRVLLSKKLNVLCHRLIDIISVDQQTRSDLAAWEVLGAKHAAGRQRE
jgi:hypothetical protein